ncbi:MAG: hypothetical protein JW772_01595, partial [Candidatus Diapherotrites archaeon]|nr:hypothetical protein [Candidatus Diapherotrites archaeon]
RRDEYGNFSSLICHLQQRMTTYSFFANMTGYKTFDEMVTETLNLTTPHSDESKKYSYGDLEEIFYPFLFPAEPTKEFDPDPVKLYKMGWVTAASGNPYSKDTFLNGTGMIFECRSRGGYSHSFENDLTYKLWAYGQELNYPAGTGSESGYGENTISHNPVLVQGIDQGGAHIEDRHVCQMYAFEEGTDYVYAAGDAANAYKAIGVSAAQQYVSELTDQKRHILYVKNKYFVVFDNLRANIPLRYSWRYHIFYDREFEFNESTMRGSYKLGNVPVQIVIIGNPSQMEYLHQWDNEALTNPYNGKSYTSGVLNDPGMYPPLFPLHHLWVSNKNMSKEFYFFTIIYPTKPGEQEPTIQKIDNWTAKITNNDGSTDVISFAATKPASATIWIDLKKLDGFIANPESGKTISITGMIADTGGTGIDGITVTAAGATTKTDLTDTHASLKWDGVYLLGNIPNGSYTLTPTKQGYTFSPASRTVEINNASANLVNFTAYETTGETCSVPGDCTPIACKTAQCIENQCTYTELCTAGQLCCDGQCTTPECVSNSGCGASQVCRNQNTCTAFCETLPACAEGEATEECFCGSTAIQAGQYCCSGMPSDVECSEIPQCETTADCDTGICCNNLCVEPVCTTDDECGAGETCANKGTCTAECVTIAACGEGEVTSECLCGSTIVSNGYCCSGTPSQTTCEDLQTCTTDNDCDTGICCNDLCIEPICTTDNECDTGETCQNAGTCNATCTTTTTPPTKCTNDNECATGELCCSNQCKAIVCGSNSECAAGYECFNPGACTAKCSLPPLKKMKVTAPEYLVHGKEFEITVLDDETNNPIANAAVKYGNEEKQTNSEGKAKFTAQQGVYLIRIEKNGYEKITLQRFVKTGGDPGNTTTISGKLQITILEENVYVNETFTIMATSQDGNLLQNVLIQ